MKKHSLGFSDEFFSEYKITETEDYTFYEFNIEETSPLEWLKHQVFTEKVYYQNREKTLEVAGGENLLSSSCDLDDLENFLNQSNLDYLFAFSTLPFEKAWTPQWYAFKTFSYFIPRFQLIQSYGNTILLVTHHNSEDPQQTLDKLSKSQQYTSTNTQIQSQSYLPNPQDWHRLFSKTQNQLQKYKKLVLARKESIELSEPADPYVFLQQSQPQTYRWMLQANPQDIFISLSPERLFYLNNGQLQTEAVAGTRPRCKNIIQDHQLEKDLLNSDKDLIEHKIVVQDIKQSLDKFFNNIEYPAQPEILKQPTVQHLKTPIQAKHSRGATTEEILFALHPTSAVCGSPQNETLQWLTENQGFERGLYASALGIMHRDFSEWTVGIRCARIHNHNLDLFSGVGIVPDSDEHQEWEEMNQKSQQLKELL